MNAVRRWRKLAFGILGVAIPALCCGPFFPVAVFVKPHQPDEPYAQFAGGRLGVPQPGYRVRHLALAYEYLSGRPLSASEQKDAIRADSMLSSYGTTPAPMPGLSAWVAVRDAFGAVDGLSSGNTATTRSVPNASYDQFTNCLDDSFANAAKTLSARQAEHGAHSPEVSEWVRGQDAVFRNCGDIPAVVAPGTYGTMAPPPVSMPGPLTNAPTWLTQDRAYQTAAAQFYSLQYTEALKGFHAIAADHSSPWSVVAEYMTARTMIRQATIGAATVNDNFKSTQEQRDQAQKDQTAGLIQAQRLLRTMRVEARMQPMRTPVEHLLDWVSLRATPEAQALVLASRLSERKDGNFAQDLIDLSFVVDRAPLSSFKPGDAPAVTANPKSAMWAWVSVVSRQDEQGALSNWRVSHRSVWLLAALMAAKPGDASNLPLLQEAASVSTADPGYVAITYHRLRLMPTNEATRAELTRIRTSLGEGVGPSASNLFAQLDAASAPNLEEWLQTAGRRAASIEEDFGDEVGPSQDMKPLEQICGPAVRASDQVFFTEQAASALNTRFPLATLAKAAEAKDLAPGLQFALAQSTWTRALLLDRPEIAKRMTPLLVGCRSAWKPFLAAYDGANGEDARKVAALLALMRFASTEPNVRAGVPRREGFATYSPFRDNWWRKTVTASPGAMAAFESASENPPAVTQNQKATGGLLFLTNEEDADANREIEALNKIPSASDYFASEAVAWWRAHPNDPVDVELLGQAMRVARNAPRTNHTTENQHALFNALHTAFPRSDWAKRYTSWE